MQPRLAAGPSALALLTLLVALRTAAAADSFSTPKRVPQVKLCITGYNLTVDGPVTGNTVTGFACDDNNAPMLSEPIGLFSFMATPPTCNFAVTQGKPGQYESFVTAMVTFGQSSVAYQYMRTIFVRPRNDSVTACLDGDGKPNGACWCDTEPEVNVITGTSGKFKAKNIRDIQSNVTFNPITYARTGSVITVSYKRLGPNVAYL